MRAAKAPSSTTSSTIPIRSASAAPTFSPSSIIRVARPWPISRGRVNDEPLSADNATPAKAMVNDDDDAASRRSQANARAAPAPAATPLTAASTGLRIPATALISGL